MNLKRSSTMFLKVIIFLAGISVLALCIFLVPEMADFTANLYPNIAPIKYLVFIVMYGAAVPFYVALYQAFNLLQYIDENTAFSELSVKALKNIKRCAITISGLYVLSLPLFHFIAKKTSNTIEKRMISLVLMSLTFCIFCKTHFRFLISFASRK